MLFSYLIHFCWQTTTCHSRKPKLFCTQMLTRFLKTASVRPKHRLFNVWFNSHICKCRYWKVFLMYLKIWIFSDVSKNSFFSEYFKILVGPMLPSSFYHRTAYRCRCRNQKFLKCKSKWQYRKRVAVRGKQASRKKKLREEERRSGKGAKKCRYGIRI